MTPPGIEPAIFRLVTQSLSRMRHRVPPPLTHTHTLNSYVGKILFVLVLPARDHCVGRRRSVFRLREQLASACLL